MFLIKLGNWQTKRAQKSHQKEDEKDERGQSRRTDRSRRNHNERKQDRREKTGEDRNRRDRNPKQQRSQRTFGKRKQSPPAKKWVEASGEIVSGSRVRMQDGLFAGRDGDVIEFNSKSEAKVLVGQFPTWVPLKSLTLLKED